MASQSTSMALSLSEAWPPFSSTQRGPKAHRSRAACCISGSVDSSGLSSSSRASGRFGVMIVAILINSDFKLAMASSWSNTCPLVDTITGSMTSWNGKRCAASSPWHCARRASATTLTISGVASMPVFTTSAPRSSKTERICCWTKSIGMGKTPCTPCEFCAVRALMAVMPKAPSAEHAFRSAWMPAPPPLSDPATMSTLGGMMRAARNSAGVVSVAVAEGSRPGSSSSKATQLSSEVENTPPSSSSKRDLRADSSLPSIDGSAAWPAAAASAVKIRLRSILPGSTLSPPAAACRPVAPASFVAASSASAIRQRKCSGAANATQRSAIALLVKAEPAGCAAPRSSLTRASVAGSGSSAGSRSAPNCSDTEARRPATSHRPASCACDFISTTAARAASVQINTCSL
mmetsp:Transcript_83005/g.240152  ORF Transcript_83005/g.240152 Transcript_83005/m.240152 type:complete len:405 (-) Transcript_83005:212-1426(-)